MDRVNILAMALRLLCLLVAAAAGAQDFSTRFSAIAAEASDGELYRLLWDLPKGGDIHVHYGLSFWASDWYEAAKDRFYTRTRVAHCKDEAAPLLWMNIAKAKWESLPECERGEYVLLRDAPREKWISALVLDQNGEGRDEFFERIVPRVQEMSRDPEVAGAAFRATLRRWAAEGIRYAEIMAMPAGPSPAETLRMLKAVAAEAPLKIRYQGIFIRFAADAPQRLQAVADFVSANPDYWVGMNMAGREDNDKGNAPRFLEPFREMRRRHGNLALSLHGGEVDNPGHEVRDTLKLGAVRIGHGVNLISDPETMLLMRAGKYLVESNLVSNQLLEYTPEISKHPFAEYLRFGIPVCLNTDDQGSWDSSLTDEYFTAVRAFRLSWDEVVNVGRNSLAYSFAPAALKRELLNNYDIAVANFERKYAAGDWRKTLAGVSPVISGYARRKLRVD